MPTLSTRYKNTEALEQDAVATQFQSNLACLGEQFGWKKRLNEPCKWISGSKTERRYSKEMSQSGLSKKFAGESDREVRKRRKLMTRVENVNLVTTAVRRRWWCSKIVKLSRSRDQKSNKLSLNLAAMTGLENGIRRTMKHSIGAPCTEMVH